MCPLSFMISFQFNVQGNLFEMFPISSLSVLLSPFFCALIVTSLGQVLSHHFVSFVFLHTSSVLAVISPDVSTPTPSPRRLLSVVPPPSEREGTAYIINTVMCAVPCGWCFPQLSACSAVRP